MSLTDRVFRQLLRILPAEFRGDYSHEMEATFRAERREATGAMALARVWTATIADVFRAAPAEHLDILRRDLSYTLRMLARRPVLTLTATLTDLHDRWCDACSPERARHDADVSRH